MKRDVTFEIVYPHPPEKVWRALTDRRALSEWLMENDFEPRTGHKFTFRTKPAPGFDGVVHCQVITLDEPRCLSYTWRGGPINTTVTWKLEPTANGTRLRLAHTGFTGLRGMMLAKLLGGGWNKMLNNTLPDVLKRVTDDGFIPAPPGALARGCH
jgi:uncharacterized protein YndB with AHSA1/START domain